MLSLYYEAFYYLNTNGKLHDSITHVDNFNLVGTPDFVKHDISVVQEELTVSKIEEDVFRFMGLDTKSVETGIEISMEDYSKSLKDITEIGRWMIGQNL